MRRRRRRKAIRQIAMKATAAPTAIPAIVPPDKVLSFEGDVAETREEAGLWLIVTILLAAGIG